MSFINRSVSVELKISFFVFCIALLNVSVLTLLSTTSDDLFEMLQGNLILTFFIYFFFAISSVFLIYFKKGKLLKTAFFLLLIYITFHVILNLIMLITSKSINDNGLAILNDAGLIWISSILVFSLWYWIIDRNGPVARGLARDETRFDLLFPQYQSKIPGWENWKPQFLDYVFFSFFTSTGFSPTDTLPLTKRVKIIMITEATLSLIIIGMVASRAISLIQ